MWVWLPILFRATPAARNPVAGHFAQKPTRRRQGILEAATEHLRRYGEPVSPTGMLYQGNL